jgi:transposase
VHKQNRQGLGFRCVNCGFLLNADLNASRNIGVLGMSEYLRLFVNEPNVASNETMPTGTMGGSYKLLTSVRSN